MKALSDCLQEMKDDKTIDWKLHKQLYPTTNSPPKFYGLPKIHKTNMPLRPIVSSVGSLSYNSAKYLSTVLSPMVGKTEHFVKNSKHFATLIKNKQVEEDEVLISYDVSALFTSVPVDRALDIIHNKLLGDPELTTRTTMSPQQVTRLLGLCLNCTYFVLEGNFYQQIHGAAMGSPVSPIVCNLYMEHFEEQALRTAPHPPGWWFRYVDDTHTKQKVEHVEEFTEHINSIDPDIKFTMEKEENGSLAFLDINTIRKPDGSLKITIYRKPTHTDQYLDFNSHHPNEHKLSVVRTLFGRAKSIISEEQDLNLEMQHVSQALTKCHYPEWALKKGREQAIKPKSDTESKRVPGQAKSKGNVVLPYIQGTSEQLRRAFLKHKISVSFKPHKTLGQLLVHPKDKPDKKDICGLIYHIKCDGHPKEQCSMDYIGETERNLKARFMEHRRPSSTSSEVSRHIHDCKPDHTITMENVRILDREPSWFERGVREAIYIRALRPALNKDGAATNSRTPGTIR
jgi:hypothetical protein